MKILLTQYLLTFVGIFVDTLSALLIILSHLITNYLVVLVNYSTFSQLHVVRFQIVDSKYKVFA